MEFIAFIIFPLLLAIAIRPLSSRLRAHHQGWLLAIAMGALFLFASAYLPAVSGGATAILTIPWMPSLGLELSFYIDGLALLFMLVITGVGIAVFFYAGYYFDSQKESARFYAILLVFTSSMLLLVTAGNIILLFIAWELTSITSFLLISFKGKYADARAGALRALMITGGGGLALFAGLLVLGYGAGTFSIPDILNSGSSFRESPLYIGAAVLIIIGCFSKSAQFPLHFWLPGAMSAPTPASAFLHSATMVKAGVYLLARLQPTLGNTPLWENALLGFGLATLLIGAIIALWQRDLKSILAYSTVSQLGAFVALIGLPNGSGLKAATVGIVAHALYKGALFLVAGIIDHATGTRDIQKLGQLRHKLPLVAWVAGGVALSMAGIPPLLGFVAKETLLDITQTNPIPLGIVVVSAALTVTVALRLFWDVFIAPPVETEAPIEHMPSPLMSAAPGMMAVFSILLGIGVDPLLSPIASMVSGKTVHIHLFPPEGINTPFMLSIVAVASGLGLFGIRRWWARWNFNTFISGNSAYQRMIGLLESAGNSLLWSQGGKIRYYLVVILLSVALLLASSTLQLLSNLRIPNLVFTGVTDILKASLLILALGATLASILYKRHLLAALLLGVAGYAIGLIFLLEPAPDVALVQFLVETLATVLIILILTRTSDEEREKAMKRLWGQTRRGIARDVVVSVVIGTAVGIFALASVSNRPMPNPIAEWHLANALPQAGVNDVVAGIITDFRGMDTVIEITVFSMAALGILSILARPKPQSFIPSLRRSAQLQTMEIMRVENESLSPISQSRFINPVTKLASVIVLPIALLIAIAHILYAGVGPGDGFTAGVIAGLGVALWFIIFGYEETKQRLNWLRPAVMVAIGLSIVIMNAALPLLFGREFLALTKVTAFSFADIKLASSLLFEIGIFASVFGGISAIMEAITHPREVEPL